MNTDNAAPPNSNLSRARCTAASHRSDPISIPGHDERARARRAVPGCVPRSGSRTRVLVVPHGRPQTNLLVRVRATSAGAGHGLLVKWSHDLDQVGRAGSRTRSPR
jgi:hypothetical protein